MPEQLVVREPARPLRSAVRAAAVVILATGASGVVAQLAPHYGPLYAYIAALVTIAWLEGVVPALLGAAVAVAAYVLIFAPASMSTREWGVLAAATLLVVIAVSIVRWRRRPLPAEIKAAPTPAPVADGDAEAVRAQLADALAKLYEANQARAADAAAARESETLLCEQYEQENEHTQRAAALALEEVERVRQENEDLRRRVEEERAACEHLDAVWGEKLQKIVSELATDHENDLGEAVAQREEARAEVRSLQMKLAAPQQAGGKSASPRRPLILVVHHDPTMRSMSRDNLDKGGFEIITAADGLEGLRLAVAHKPAVVVADSSMPKMDGRELCQLIKSNQETAGVKVLLITADEREDTSRQLGPDELLRKPVKFDELRGALTKLVGSA